MILQDIANRLRNWLPLYTDKFSDKIKINSITNDTNLQEMTLTLSQDLPNSLEVGSIITLSKISNSIPLNVLQAYNGNGIAITNGITPHDVTLGKIGVVEFNNSSIPSLNGAFIPTAPPKFAIESALHDGNSTITIKTIENNYFPSDSNFKVLIQNLGGYDVNGEFNINVIDNKTFTYEVPSIEPSQISVENAFVSGCFNEWVMFFKAENINGISDPIPNFLQKHRLGFNGNFAIKAINSNTEIVLENTRIDLANPIGSDMQMHFNIRVGLALDITDILNIKKDNKKYIYISTQGSQTVKDTTEETEILGSVLLNQINRFINNTTISIDLVIPTIDLSQKGGLELDTAYSLVPIVHKILYGYRPPSRFVQKKLPSGLLPINENVELTSNNAFVYRINYQHLEYIQLQGSYENTNMFDGFLNLGAGDGIITETIALKEIEGSLNYNKNEKEIAISLKQG